MTDFKRKNPFKNPLAKPAAESEKNVVQVSEVVKPSFIKPFPAPDFLKNKNSKTNLDWRK